MKKILNIGVFSSSSDLGSKFESRIWLTKKLFESKKFNINLGKLAFASNGYTSGDPKQRADEFNALIENNDILLSMVGGLNSSSILEFIDYKKVSRYKPKVVGYSDTTALLLAIYKKTNLIVYYGPAFLTSFFENDYISNWHFKVFNKIIVNNKNIALMNPKKWTEQKLDWSIVNRQKQMSDNKLISFNDGIIIGRLIGGNLNTIVSIFHTKYMPEIEQGDILFIEDSLKSAAECERNFAFLKNTGILNKASGIILGKCEGFNRLQSKETYYTLFMKFLDRKIPVLAQFDCGHTQPMNVMKIGAIIKLDTFKKQVIYL